MKQILTILEKVADFFLDYDKNVMKGRIFGIVSNKYKYTLKKEYLPKFLVFIFFVPLWIIAFFLDLFLFVSLSMFAALFVFPIILPIVLFVEVIEKGNKTEIIIYSVLLASAVGFICYHLGQ